MSLALLLEKYDVSTEEGLQKALNEIEKEENDVDDALSSALSRASTLEGKLRTASQAYTKLGAVKADAQTAEDMVVKTATLAQDVSAKVRQLDLARSRVAECQRRVHDLIDLQLCCAGVEAAIKAHDYETGAQHVARFLSMDPGSVAAARAREPGAPDPRAAMAAAAGTLREHLVTKLTEACGRADEAAVWRLARLFPQIGCAREGVDLLAQYLAKQVDTQIRKLCKIPDASSETAFADAFSVIVECGGGAVRKLGAARPPGLLPHALKHLQPAVSAAARRLYTEMCSARQLNSLLTGGGGGGGSTAGGGGGGGGGRRPTPLAVEPPLAELAAAHATIKMYFAFLMRQAEADAATLDEAARLECIQAVEKIISDSDLLRTAQNILGHYLALERYFLEESVNKAIKMSAGAATSSLVDDVFFIARKVIRRSLSTGSVDGACAVLNDAASLLELSVASELRRALRAAPPDTLPLGAPGAGGGGELGLRMNRELEAQRQLFLAQLNEAEAGAEWSMRLATEAVAEASPLLASDRDRDKLTSVAAGLGGAAAALRGARAAGLAALRAALRPRLLAWADALVDAEGEHDDDDTEADALPSALDALSAAARAALSAAAADELLLAAVTDLTARAEARILHHTYDRESGIRVERRARRLAAWAGGAGGGAARERAARLTQGAALLALEAAGQAGEALRPHRVPPPRAREILARRSDFKIEDIKRLKL